MSSEGDGRGGSILRGIGRVRGRGGRRGRGMRRGAASGGALAAETDWSWMYGSEDEEDERDEEPGEEREGDE